MIAYKTREILGHVLAVATRGLSLGAALFAAAGGATLTAQVSNPTFSNVTVHDPSVIKAGARWYVYGSHGASAWTEDLMNWTQVATTVNFGSPAHFNTFASELSELIAWTNASTLWASDVVQLPDGKFYYYYNVWTDYLGYRSYMGLASADGIEGPFTDLGEIMKGGTNVAGFNASVHPNTIDPDVFYDRDGQLWMVYGSYSGGIFILRLDQTVGSPTFGRPLPDQGWGTKLIGGNHVRIEGPCIIYSPESEYYYLFLSFGGLGANDGYNIRVGRSRNPDGPYVDADGTDLTNVAGPNGTFFNDAAIAPHGVKLMGNYQFLRVSGEPGTQNQGYLSPGHNSAYYDPASGKYFLVFHTRFVGRGEQHEVRVHQMWLNADGWLVVAPHRYARETLSAIDPAQIPGSFKIINHGKAISSAVNTSVIGTFNADGSISGDVSGNWTLSGDNAAAVTVNGTTYRGVFAPQWDDDTQVWVLGFTALSGDGTALWGSKVAAVTPSVGPAVSRQPAHATASAGARVTLSAGATGLPPPTFQWKRNGATIADATGSSFAVAAAAPANAGVYTAEVTSGASVTTDPVVLGVTTTAKVLGAGTELGPDIQHPNGNSYDQLLLQGTAATLTADAGQITRISYCDLTDDIVQVEFSGAGSLTITLENASPPAPPVNYEQPTVQYMKGHARVVIAGADETTHVSIFTVGRANAVNLGLFKDNVNYDGWADVASLSILSANGRFGSIRTANARYTDVTGVVGVFAPGVQVDGPVFVGNISASDAATPMLLLGNATDARITGGDLAQPNAQPVRISGIAQLKFTDGSSSHGVIIPARAIAGRLQENGVDVTERVAVNPP